MKYYIDVNGTYLGGWDDNPPGDSVEVEAPPPSNADQPWLFPGWGPSPGQLRKVEDDWRAIEMPIARENVTAIEFGDDKIPGTAAQWKAYWLALRAWVEGAEGYPDATQRPLKPT